MRKLPIELIACCAMVFCMAATTAPTTQSTLAEKCEMLRGKWQPRFAHEHLDVIVAPPFVVAGDGGEARVRGYVTHTINAAADALHRKFFDRQPNEPILILLFESDEPYRRLAKAWFGDTDISRYGYFRHNNIMVMNVGTGTGTLVHELTHALIKPDFPEVPSWFNEGLGSLFEQCTLGNGADGGDIRGLENWRLAGLQRTIKQDKLRPVSELIEDQDFYADDKVGINYAQARYLLMYLQEQGKLPAMYRQFRANHADDPSGLKTLKAVIAPRSLESFEKDWRAWVLKLRF